MTHNHEKKKGNTLPVGCMCCSQPYIGVFGAIQSSVGTPGSGITYTDELEKLKLELARKEAQVELLTQELADLQEKVYGAPAEKVTEASAIKDLLDGGEPSVVAEIDEPLTISATDMIKVSSGKKLTVILNNEVTVDKLGFGTEEGGEVVIKGNGGTIKASDGMSGNLVQANGGKVTIEDVILDTSASNNAYPVFGANNAEIKIGKGTVIKAGKAPAVSGNNGLGAIQSLNIEEAEISSTDTYGIYLPCEATVTIKDSKVNGILARTGNIDISGKSVIGPIPFTADKITTWENLISYTGWVNAGPTIAILLGTYAENTSNVTLNINEGAKVTATYAEAIGVYQIDTKVKQDATITIANEGDVTTTADGKEAVKTFSHEDITAGATEEGVQDSYNPTFESTVSIQ